MWRSAGDSEAVSWTSLGGKELKTEQAGDVDVFRLHVVHHPDAMGGEPVKIMQRHLTGLVGQSMHRISYRHERAA